jgi:hypothetical protein
MRQPAFPNLRGSRTDPVTLGKAAAALIAIGLTLGLLGADMFLRLGLWPDSAVVAGGALLFSLTGLTLTAMAWWRTRHEELPDDLVDDEIPF